MPVLPGLEQQSDVIRTRIGGDAPPLPTGPPAPPPPTPAPAAPVAGTPASWDDVISAIAKKHQVDPRLALAVAQTESSLNPAAVSPKGARGLFQLMPETIARRKVNPDDPVDNIRGGMEELRDLLAANHGDVVMALRRYNGSPQAPREATDPYVQAVLGRLTGGKTPPPPTTPTIPPPTPATTPPVDPDSFAAQHPWLNSMAQSLDPHEVEGRQNIAGGIGGVAGAAVGGLAGGLAGPGGVLVGRRVGAGIGAGLAGAAEQALVEETPLGKWIGDTLPLGKTDVVPPPPPPGSTFGRRVATAGGTQAAYDFGGQIIGKGLGIVGKRIVQTPVGQAALHHFENQWDTTIGAAQAALDALNAQRETLQLHTGRLGRAVTDAMGVVRERARGAAQDTVGQVADAVRTRASQARTLADAAVLGAQQTADRAMAGIKSAGQRGLDAASQAYESLIGRPPPEIGAGRAVVETVHGPVQAARDAAGQAVDEAAASGPAVDIRRLKAEAERIARTELMPPEKTFPHAPPPPPGPPGSPPPPPTLAQLGDQITTTQLQELLKHPAMGVIDRILNAPEVVPFHDAHLWKSQLQRGLGSTYDAARKSQVEGITQHLAAELRRALTGHAPYDEATARYGAIARLFEDGYGSKLAAVARSEPEKIVQMIKPDDPSATRMLVDMLTTVAREGGGDEGAAVGGEALAQVRGAWLHRHVLGDGIAGLGKNLADLRARPEFVHALFGDANAQAILTNLEAQAAGYARLVAEQELELAAQAISGKQAVETTRATVGQATRGVRDAGAAEIRAARRSARAAKGPVDDITREVQEAVTRLGEDKAAAMHAKIVQAQADLRAGKAMAPEMKAFLESTLGPKNLRKAEQTAADLVNAALRLPTYWGGLSAFRILQGATDKDLLLYAAHSGPWMQRFVRHVVTGPAPGLAVSTAARIAKPVVAAGRSAKTPAPQQ